MKTCFFILLLVILGNSKGICQDTTNKKFKLSESFRQKLNIDESRKVQVESIIGEYSERFRLLTANKAISFEEKKRLFNQLQDEQERRLKEVLDENQYRDFRNEMNRVISAKKPPGHH